MDNTHLPARIDYFRILDEKLKINNLWPYCIALAMKSPEKQTLSFQETMRLQPNLNH